MPVFRIVTETGYLCPAVIEAGRACEMNCAALPEDDPDDDGETVVIVAVVLALLVAL